MASDPSSLLERAQDLHRTGGLHEAESLYRGLIRTWPLSPQAARALTNLGLIAQEQGRGSEAQSFHDRALELAPNLAEAWCNRGDLFSDLERLSEAEADFARAAALKPDLAPAWFNRGNVLMRMGRTEDAEPCYRRAAELLPALPLVRAQLARCLDSLNRPAEAAEVMEEAVRLSHGDWCLLSDLGALQQKAGRYADAKETLRTAIGLRPSHGPAHYNLGNAFYGEGLADKAAACWRTAWDIDPKLAQAASNHLNALHYLPKVSGEETARAHWRTMDRLRAAEAGHEHLNTPDPDRVLRVGFVSADFRRHPVGLLLRPVLPRLRGDRLFLAAYSTGTAEDEVTAELRAACDLWRDCAGLDDVHLARRIRGDLIDVLIDLDGHTAGNRLGTFALRPAPVQAGWLGYPFTSGLATMDYILMDRATVPEEAEPWFREKVVILPGSRLSYVGPDRPEPAPPPMPAKGFVTFGSFNNIAKLNDEVAAAWTSVLKRVPGSRLLLKWPHLAHADVAGRIRALFAGLGIGPERLDLRGNSPPESLMAEYGEIDVGLDPFPYSGAFTSCEALWMGVPVVTLPGPRPFSRQTLALLEPMGLTSELARFDVASYCDLAVELAGDAERLAELRRRLRPAMRRALGDSGPLAAALSDFLHSAWTEWCGKKKGEA